MRMRNAAEEWMKCTTVEETVTITRETDMEAAPAQVIPTADLHTLMDHLREEAMNGRHTYR